MLYQWNLITLRALSVIKSAIKPKSNTFIKCHHWKKNDPPGCSLLIKNICMWTSFQLCVFVINAITRQRSAPKSKENFFISLAILIERRLCIVNYLMSVIWRVHTEIRSQPRYLGLCPFILELSGSPGSHRGWIVGFSLEYWVLWLCWFAARAYCLLNSLKWSLFSFLNYCVIDRKIKRHKRFS